MYDYDEQNELGAQGFATVGEYEDAEMLGAAPFAAMRPRLPAAQQQRPAAPARFNPAIARGLPSPRGGLAGITPDQCRAIVREELSRVQNQRPLVPWSGMPVRATPRDEAMWPLGLGLVTFDSTTGVNLQLEVQPQRPFRGERLVLDIRRIGASAAAPTVTIVDLRVGDTPQRIGGGALPAEVFAPDAFGVRLSLDASVPGVLVTVGFKLVGPALAPGDSIIVSGAIIGRATESADR